MEKEKLVDYLRDPEGKDYPELVEAYERLEPLFQDILFLFYRKKETWVKIAIRLNYCPSHCRRLRHEALEKLEQELRIIASENSENMSTQRKEIGV